MNNFININLNLYKSFYYVAKFGGFTNASEHAMLSQSSLSSNVKNLEEALDKKLFNRTNKTFSLTSDGEELLEKLENIISIIDSEIKKNEINIGCLRFIADNYICDTIYKYKKQYSDIKINFNFSNITTLYQLLRRDEIDIIIGRYPLFYKFDNSISIEKIIDVKNVFVCSKKYYEQEKNKMKNNNYLYSMILPVNSEKRRNIEQYLIDKNINYRVEVELPNSNLLKKLIINGIGIGYINKKSIQKEIDNNDVVILDNFNDVPLDNISIMYNNKKNNIYLNEFIDILKSTIGKINN